MSRKPAFLALTATVALAAAGCGFNLSGPFEGFDGQGSRVTGRFDTTDAGAASGQAAAAAAASFEGLRVSVRERAALSTAVSGSGAFALVGVPSGAFSVVFDRGGAPAGEIRFQSVRANQEIRIVVALTGSGEVVLMDEKRDRVSFDEDCPRGPGFWCQNRNGQNPNLSRAEFEAFAARAAELLAAVPALDTPAEIEAAVCDTGDQLLRQLATLALNLAGEATTRETALSGEPYPTVGAAFDAAVAAAGGASGAERNAIKDVLDRINNGRNVAGCDVLPDDDDDDGDEEGEPVPPPSSAEKITICHIPPGNPANRQTITISANAWPAHRAHGDTIGACVGGRR